MTYQEESQKMPKHDTQARLAQLDEVARKVILSGRPRTLRSSAKEPEPSPSDAPSSEHPASSLASEPTPSEEQHEDEDDGWRPDADPDQESESNVYQAPESTADALRRIRGQELKSSLSQSPESTAHALRRVRDQQVELNKENLEEERAEGVRKKPRFFNERQESATRVTFEDDDDEEGPPRTQRTGREEVRSGENGNRNEQEDGEDDEEDDAFETDDRPADEVRRVEKPAVGRSGNVPRQIFFNGGSGGVRRDLKQTTLTGANPPRDEPRRGHQEPSPSVEEDNDDGQIPYRKINQLAKTTVALRGPRKVQIRRPWSEQATARLIELIEDDRYSTSWVMIDNLKDPLLEGRGQGALKDKARNIKMDFLKAGIELPINFENVRLNRLQIETLHDLGIPYEQDRLRG
ncbi:MAG: hypothetical protein M1823_004977 [Watsoniomyces obsoletus]|nr:MAG: hypothetical protein M1823_004977 [Watsoniomyces obsoletus]